MISVKRNAITLRSLRLVSLNHVTVKWSMRTVIQSVLGYEFLVILTTVRVCARTLAQDSVKLEICSIYARTYLFHICGFKRNFRDLKLFYYWTIYISRN